MVKELCSFDSGLASIHQAIFDKSGTYVVVASEDASIKMYAIIGIMKINFRFNLNTKEKESELKGHEDAVLDICWDSGREGMLISASSDCSFRVW